MATRWLKIRDLASRYGVGRRTISRWRAAGLLPAPRRVGLALRWSAAVLGEFDNAHPAGSDAEWEKFSRENRPDDLDRDENKDAPQSCSKDAVEAFRAAETIEVSRRKIEQLFSAFDEQSDTIDGLIGDCKILVQYVLLSGEAGGREKQELEKQLREVLKRK